MWELISFIASMIVFGMLSTVGYYSAIYFPAWIDKKFSSLTSQSEDN